MVVAAAASIIFFRNSCSVEEEAPLVNKACRAEEEENNTFLVPLVVAAEEESLRLVVRSRVLAIMVELDFFRFGFILGATHKHKYIPDTKRVYRNYLLILL